MRRSRRRMSAGSCCGRPSLDAAVGPPVAADECVGCVWWLHVPVDEFAGLAHVVAEVVGGVDDAAPDAGCSLGGHAGHRLEVECYRCTRCRGPGSRSVKYAASSSRCRLPPAAVGVVGIAPDAAAVNWLARSWSAHSLLPGNSRADAMSCVAVPVAARVEALDSNSLWCRRRSPKRAIPQSWMRCSSYRAAPRDVSQ